MKKDITTRESETCTGLFWKSWSEICDCCGKQYRHNGAWDTTDTPNMDKEDLCLDCLYFALDHDIHGPGKVAEKIKAAMAAEEAKRISERTETKA